jgi:hypothetical protein
LSRKRIIISSMVRMNKTLRMKNSRSKRSRRSLLRPRQMQARPRRRREVRKTMRNCSSRDSRVINPSRPRQPIIRRKVRLQAARD